MLYVHRDEKGHIISISKIKDAQHPEELPEKHPEILLFTQAENERKAMFLQSDLQMIRVLDDLIDLLIQKHVITFTELPPFAQDKILTRQHLRDKLANLLSGENDTIKL